MEGLPLLLGALLQLKVSSMNWIVDHMKGSLMLCGLIWQFRKKLTLIYELFL